ncbi:MAG: HAMP domain-containing histidine kinase [Ruminococcus sp.]|nr:HAMP domain-containing histidine kinase [Ruminococcus sp.]
MEKAVKRSLRLRADFIKYVAAAFLCAAALSLIAILGCIAVRGYLVPSSDKVYLNWTEASDEPYEKDVKPHMGFMRLTLAEPTEINPFYTDETNRGRVARLGWELIGGYELVSGKEDLVRPLGSGGVDVCVTRVYNSPESLTPKRKFVYYASGAAMVAVPILLSLAAVLMCGFLFYEEKLKKPIGELSAATEKIAAQDLDFSVGYVSPDELGALCGSFEQMRAALRENNEKMWQMLAERRQLQASVAHDLRNPIAIIKGHTEYLKLNAEKGRLSGEKILSVSDNIADAAVRLEHYTESVRTLNHLEDLDVERAEVDFAELFGDIREDFAAMPKRGGVSVRFGESVGERVLRLDRQALYRVIENLVGNALRFAESVISVDFSYADGRLTVRVSDDGRGFSDKVLRARERFFITDRSDSTHSGLGLTICRILSRKHGGGLVIGNDGGAFVEVFLEA